MPINGYELTLSWDGEPSAGLQRATELLQAKGYTLDGRQGNCLTMKFKGAFITMNPDKMRHSLTIDVKGNTWTFHYSTGAVASYWTPKDIEWAQQRSQGIIDAL